ncbi:MAG: Rpn family recombination-promoting nuclease/putative transposase [Myxococcaceae bacterium]|nr:Rpn family recombination-promoting nuclease/putative transposase [Myxococcaceae bacterium]
MPGPHDLFARFTFGHPERAAAELRAVLPPEVVARVDWSSLRREPGSVVDPELRESQSDLLFSARLLSGQPLLLYLLLEHQSSVDRWMALRMLRYVVRQLEHWRQEHPESEVLPVVVPVVMYHGLEGAWTAPRRIEELFDLPAEQEQREGWRVWVPRFEYLLDDLTSEREEALRARAGPPLARLAFLVLRYGRSRGLAQQLERWTAVFAQVYATPEGLEELRAVVNYLLEVGDLSARGPMRRVLRTVVGTQRVEELMRTMADEFREEGRRQGRREGRAEDVLRILAVRGVAVDEKTRELILTCTDLVTLDRWFERALTATHLSEFLESQ